MGAVHGQCIQSKVRLANLIEQQIVLLAPAICQSNRMEMFDFRTVGNQTQSRAQ